MEKILYVIQGANPMNKDKRPIVPRHEIERFGDGVMGPINELMCYDHEVRRLESYADQQDKRIEELKEFIGRIAEYAKSSEIEGFYDRFTLSDFSPVYDGLIEQCRSVLSSLNKEQKES
jgi:hypothetical protein